MIQDQEHLFEYFQRYNESEASTSTLMATHDSEASTSTTAVKVRLTPEFHKVGCDERESTSDSIACLDKKSNAKLDTRLINMHEELHALLDEKNNVIQNLESMVLEQELKVSCLESTIHEINAKTISLNEIDKTRIDFQELKNKSEKLRSKLDIKTVEYENLRYELENKEFKITNICRRYSSEI